MDPVTAIGLTAAILDIFKDTYLVGKWIHATVRSAINHDAEKTEVAEEFYFELLKLQSFGRWFEKSRETIMNDSELDRLWLGYIYNTFERLSEDFAEYRAFAEKTDDDYRRFSPLVRPELRQKGLIGFISIDKDLPKTTGGGLNSLWWSPKTKITQSDLFIGAKWALFQATRFRRVVGKFRKRNNRLQEILPMAIAARLQNYEQSLSSGDHWMDNLIFTDRDARRLGLAKHAQIRQLIQNPKTAAANQSAELHLKNTTVISDSEKSTLHIGVIETVKARGNVERQNVLIEYKYYIPLQDLEAHKATLQLPNNNTSASVIPQSVAQLGGLLYSSGSNKIGTLPLKGFLDQPEKGRFAFIFNFPENTQSASPCSLHEIIRSYSYGSSPDGSPEMTAATTTTTAPLELGLRFRIAHFLASKLSMLHVDRWIHKNISSHSLVFFRDRHTEQNIFNDPYVVDFEYSRPDTGSSLRLVDRDFERNLYRHPEIQFDDRPSFSRSHDLYALGIVLVEIAVWETARQIVEEGIADRSKWTADNIRALYIKTAQVRVPSKMGKFYTRAVLACLTSEFEDQYSKPDFPRIFQDEVVKNLSVKLTGASQ